VGIGAEAVRQLAKHNPAHIYFSSRNAAQGKTLIDSIKTTIPDANLTFIPCDLTSFESIQSVKEKFTSDRLDILVCNAGVMAVPPALTKEGYEIQFGINHMGHALLIKLLLPKLLKTAEEPGGDARIIILSSTGHENHPRQGIVFKDLHTTQENISLVAAGFFRYGQSKLANMLYAGELAKHYPQITSVSVHPGIINTAIISGLRPIDKAILHTVNFLTVKKWTKEEEGCYNTLWAMTTEKKNLKNGEFYHPVGEVGPRKGKANDPKLGEELWQWTENELKDYN
jgi:NAD(P)-dependent dehydrogenase (short-subunit alcohol dehydrogenase family)